jgi:uncharacterized membrane protein
VTVVALDSYSIIMAVHIMAVVAAFGLPLGYPLLVPYVRRTHPEALSAVHEVQLRLNRMVTAPGIVIVLVAGIYLASDADLWSEAWVSAGLAIVVVIGGIGGGIINPAVEKMIGLAKAGIGPEYEAQYRRYIRAEILLGVLVLVAIFLMATKP